ncbi:MAG: hypothetical protein ABIC91_02530, partial [Nanoarchaeota archaeon]
EVALLPLLNCLIIHFLFFSVNIPIKKHQKEEKLQDLKKCKQITILNKQNSKPKSLNTTNKIYLSYKCHFNLTCVIPESYKETTSNR